VKRRLRFTREAETQLREPASGPRKGLRKQVLKTLGLLELDTRHPGLHTHPFESLTGVNGERVWEAYAQDETPGAYRVFFHYGPDGGLGGKRVPVLTIVSVTAHP
jgi:hypothetical protein